MSVSVLFRPSSKIVTGHILEMVANQNANVKVTLFVIQVMENVLAYQDGGVFIVSQVSIEFFLDQ